jgi:signal peptidase II
VPSGGGSATGPEPRRGRPVLAAAIVSGVVIADQLTKLWAVRELARGPVSIIGTTADFRLARNTGSAFSLFQAFTPLLAIIIGFVAFFLVRAVNRARDLLMVVGLSLVLGGALGNLLDRLFRAPGFLRGGVVDFVHVGWWPTFNVADAAVTLGAIVVVVGVFRADSRDRREHELRAPGG